MQHRTLGQSGLKVSTLCLGTMMFGGATDEPTSHRIIAKAREQGVNFLDTADQYNNGKSEEVVGRGIAKSRDGWVLATKLANPMGRGATRPASRASG
jgi:aryl-alcohol dehydrogenase (NADP+)